MTAVLLLAALGAGAWSVARARRGSRAPIGGWARVSVLPLPEQLVQPATPADASIRFARAGVAGAEPGALGQARVLGAGLGVATCVPLAVVWPSAVVLALPLGVVGYALPATALGRAERARGRAIRAALPGALDLLAICVAGGMALDPALAALRRHTSGPLADELHGLLQSIELGAQRRDAYERLAARCPCEEVAGLVAAVRQSEELGAPLAPTLLAQAHAVRDGTRRAALERAATAAPRIQLVTALVLVPAAMLLIVATLLLHLGAQIGAAIGGPA